MLKALSLLFKGKGAVSKQNYLVIKDSFYRKLYGFRVKHALGRDLKRGVQTTFILNIGLA